MPCVAREFGCSCPGGTCQSVRCNIHRRLSRYDRAKAKATRALHVAAVCFAFCVVLAGVLLAAENHQKFIDIANQENIRHG